MKKYLKKILGLFLSLLIAIGTFLTPFTSSASAITTVNAEGNIEGYVYDVIREMTGVDLSDKSTWVNWKKIGNITYSYQPSVGNDAWHVTSDAVPSAYAGQSFDCVRTALFITGHALQKAGQEPTSYITKVGYDFNGNGKFTTSTDYTQAKTGDILAYGESHLAVALGWKDGELWTIDGMDGYGWGIHKYRGYASSGSTQHVFTMLYEVPHTKTINVNVTKQSLYPDCTNSNALYSLAGAEFSVVSNLGVNLGTLTTDDNGNASNSWDVDPDTSSVTVTETKAPNNYKLTDGIPKVIQLADGTTASYTWIDEPINDPGIIELKKVDKEGKVYSAPMPDAIFEIKYYDTLGSIEGSKPFRTFRIKTKYNKNSNAYIARLADDYLVSAKDRDGNDTTLFKTKDGVNILPLGTITIEEKTAPSNYTTKGGYFQNEETKQTVSSDEKMTIRIVKAGDGAMITAGNVADSNGSFIKDEIVIRGTYNLQKTDKKLLSDSTQTEYNGVRSQGDASFAGAEFDLYYLGNGTDTTSSMMFDHDGDGLGDGTEYQPSDTKPIEEAHVVLDESGYYEPTITDKETGEKTLNKTWLAYGNYKLVETKAPEGYSIYDDNGDIVTINFSLTKDGDIVNVTAPENVYDGDISITKYVNPSNTSSFAEPEPDATFDIVLKKYAQQVATKNGHSEIMKSDVIEAYNSRETWTGTDESKHSVAKYTQMEFDQITTGADGVATSKKLAYGEYVMAQVDGNKEYKEIEDVKEFTIKTEHQDTLKFQVINNEKGYIIRMIKTDKDTGKNVTYTSSAWKIHMLKDAKGNDVSKKTTNDKTVNSRLENGYVVQTLGDSADKTVYTVFKTASKEDKNLEEGVFYGASNGDEKNTLSETTAPVELLAGTYQLEEVITSEGFETHEPIQFVVKNDMITTVNANGQNIIDVKFANNQLTGGVHFKKEIEKWEDADVTLVDYDLTKFGFTLKADEDIINADDGTVLVKKGEKAVQLTHDSTNPYKTIDEVHPDKDGDFSFTDLPLGKYVLTETTVPSGYASNSHKYKIEITQTLFDKKVDEQKSILGLGETTDGAVSQDDVLVTVDGYEVEKTNAFVIVNYATRTKITKTDVTGGEELENAKITITDKDGKVVDSWTSTKKSHNIEGLNRNETYTLTEEIAPKGYYYSNDVTFTVDDNGKVVQKVEMIDNLIKFRIAKVDDYGNYVENVKLELTDVTDSNNPVKIELENGGITTKKPFELYGVLTAEHKYELVEKEHVAGVYKATKIDFTVAKYGTSEVHTITMYDDTTNVMVSKVDNHGTAVKGAKLSILEAVKNEDGTITPVLNEDGTEKAPVYSFTSENKPTDISKYVKGSNEESGDVWYILREDETPFGFETLEDQPFKVTGTKDEHQVIVAVDQRKTFYVSAVKVDANDKTKLLKGAEITLFKSDGTVAKDVNGNECKGLTDGKGVITWQVEYNGDGTGTKDSYDAGYYVQETKAPTGYRINNDHHAVTMSEDYEWSKDNAVKIVVNDTALPATSIKTGDMSNIALWGGILLFSVCGGALVIFLKKKNGTSEE